ncbi:hypothetical protein PAXINDRAFT_18915 [Paxillus involutus ATCC 200175]|uniref:Uncharacterized protein n=1 Tax=Paxillus involutus ATCC 200175 TaxID=664439 RepID=A0A0C9TIY0_PAXIN|nr:hypothetical protein PAXINDRAFT_18915 [Paxillus involutus ATCC 200175]
MTISRTELNVLYDDMGHHMVTEGEKLSQPQRDYFMNLCQAIRIVLDLNPAEQIPFVFPTPSHQAKPASMWIDMWIEQRKKTNDQTPSTSGTQVVDQQQVSQPQKRPAKTPLEQPTQKHVKKNFELIHFHVNHLLSLLDDRLELVEQVVILKQAIDVVYSGGKPVLLEWHLERVKKAIPNDPHILQAVEFLTECLSFSFQFGS